MILRVGRGRDKSITTWDVRSSWVTGEEKVWNGGLKGFFTCLIAHFENVIHLFKFNQIDCALKTGEA